jgi:EAL domain-containing protein (putative c-di-GMP-specific phosphodiesterase class I)
VGVVRAVIDLAHALGMPAIAEGVETQYEWELLASLGCDGAQGWHIARPMPAAEITEWIRARVPAVPDSGPTVLQASG